jgi:HAD superfamily hydrolase (TIGR01509 family)
VTPKKVIFWDNDGVLVDTEHLYFEATRHALAGEGIALTREIYIEHLLVGGTGVWHLAEEAGLPPERVAGLKTLRNRHYTRLLSEQAQPMPGAVETLALLRPRYAMGIVTSSLREHFEVIHRHTGIVEQMDFVVASGDYVKSKPFPDPYLRAVEVSGCVPEEAVAVEDSERGLRAALAAGVDCLVIPTDLTAACDFTGAAAVLSSLRDLPAALG